MSYLEASKAFEGRLPIGLTGFVCQISAVGVGKLSPESFRPLTSDPMPYTLN